MKRALQLAAKARPSPNPPVGAVLVKKKRRIISEGFHKKAGGPHAEIEAIRKAGKKAKGSTLYTTLEPRSHYGKTPPAPSR
ncbi:MAG: deaminase [Candidatus Norongarragalinales archaeon]